VAVSASDGRLCLTVTDDGRGLPESGQAQGLGLRSMAERAAELGGECTVEAAGQAGTRVSAVIPLATTPLPASPPAALPLEASR
jgi:signal transduction histidine kinase